jgi:mannose-6-phosphate isomerase-like protein (cupin superfamily)
MSTIKGIVLCSCVMLVGAVASADDAKKKSSPPTTAKPEAVMVNANEIKWGEAPPDFPKGAQLAVLFGDPSKEGPFTLRFKMPDGYKIMPHWHSQDEQLTVLAGTFILHMGDTLKSPAHTLGAGAFHFLPAKMHHSAEAKGETVVQVHGTGPFDIHYLNPADNPNKATAKSK